MQKITNKTYIKSYFFFCLLHSSNKVSIALFSADWAEQCIQILNVLKELAKQYTALQFIDVPAEEFSEISIKHQVLEEMKPSVLFSFVYECFFNFRLKLFQQFYIFVIIQLLIVLMVSILLL